MCNLILWFKASLSFKISINGDNDNMHQCIYQLPNKIEMLAKWKCTGKIKNKNHIAQIRSYKSTSFKFSINN